MYRDGYRRRRHSWMAWLFIGLLFMMLVSSGRGHFGFGWLFYPLFLGAVVYGIYRGFGVFYRWLYSGSVDFSEKRKNSEAYDDLFDDARPEKRKRDSENSDIFYV